jgi:hypothetical protein
MWKAQRTRQDDGLSASPKCLSSPSERSGGLRFVRSHQSLHQFVSHNRLKNKTRMSGSLRANAAFLEAKRRVMAYWLARSFSKPISCDVFMPKGACRRRSPAGVKLASLWRHREAEPVKPVKTSRADQASGGGFLKPLKKARTGSPARFRRSLGMFQDGRACPAERGSGNEADIPDGRRKLSSLRRIPVQTRLQARGRVHAPAPTRLTRPYPC